MRLWISCVGATVNSFFSFVAIFYCYYYHYLTRCASRSISFVSFLSVVHWLRASCHKWAKLEHACDSFEKILFHRFHSMERKRWLCTRVWLLIKINAKITFLCSFFGWPINLISDEMMASVQQIFFCAGVIRRSTILQSSNLSILRLCAEKNIYRNCARYERKEAYLCGLWTKTYTYTYICILIDRIALGSQCLLASIYLYGSIALKCDSHVHMSAHQITLQFLR